MAEPPTDGPPPPFPVYADPVAAAFYARPYFVAPPPALQHMPMLQGFGGFDWKGVVAAGGGAPVGVPGGVVGVPEVQMASAYRIGRYTPAERRIRLDRYREKRAQRNYNRRVKYDCRKMIADKRKRVQGRFVKREEEDALPDVATPGHVPQPVRNKRPTDYNTDGKVPNQPDSAGSASSVPGRMIGAVPAPGALDHAEKPTLEKLHPAAVTFDVIDASADLGRI